MFEKLLDLFHPSEWLVGFDEGKPPRVKGSVSRAFVRDAGDVLQKAGIQRARICGVSRRGLITLSFSDSIPKHLYQRLRNLWATHRD
jgi:hypothetical protein